MEKNIIYKQDAVEGFSQIPSNSIDCCITSPPYWSLRDYQNDLQIGLEETPKLFIEKLTKVFAEVYRVLKPEGTLWVNIGDSYAGGGGALGIPEDWDSISTENLSKFPKENDPKRNNKNYGLKKKDLVGIPWMLAFALRDTLNFYLRQDIIWAKGTSGIKREGNIMPESVTDRCTKAHEYIFLLSKSQKYFYDNDAIKEKAKSWGTRDRSNFRSGTTDPKLLHHGLDKDYESGNMRSVWRINPSNNRSAHFATFPEDLIRPMILAGCPKDGIVLDPFFGTGTTGVVAKSLGRNYIGIDINDEYINIAEKRLASTFNKEIFFV